ncbi:MAG: putative porin [Candidatus Poribacteria bacterium]|nr:putative porin [Candidatus Poribacteria bacterium]MDE0502889.1 putative porin [Candidatus Poribacteria bacterium]
MATSEGEKTQAAGGPNSSEPEDLDASQRAKELWRTYFSADGRFRQESIFREGSPSRYRYRIRFRLGGSFPIHPHADLGFRMVTGATDDPTTGNVDLDGYFSKKGFNLDRLFLRYSPSSSLTLTIGKFPNPFERVELVFHNDVQFEGAAQQFRLNDVGFIRQARLNLGQFILAESKSGADTNLFAGQLLLKGLHFDGLSFGAMLYEYRNEDTIAQAVEDSRLGGGDTNARIGAGTGTSIYQFGFRIVEWLAKYESTIRSMPVRFIGVYAQNLLADFDDTAYWLEVGVGPISRLNRLRGLYHYVRVERESMISNYNNADIFNPNMQGHGFKVALPLSENVGAEALYFVAKNILTFGANPNQHKTRLQIKAKF